MIRAVAGWIAAVALAVIAGAYASTAIFLLAALIAAVVIYHLAATRLQLAIALWLGAVILVPNWTVAHVGPLTLTPASGVGLPAVAGILGAVVIGRKRLAFTVSWMDYTFLAAGVLIIAQANVAVLKSVFVKEFVLVWAVAYFLGRLAGPFAQKVFVVLLAFVAVWGVLEFAFGVHVFESWFISAGHHWNVIQERAGVSRSEASFGHAIAYGASLVLAIPLAQRLSPRWAVTVQVIIIGGVAASLSRGPMLALVLTLVLTSVFLASNSERVRLLLITAIGGIGVYAVIQFLYRSAFADEVERSGQARGNQLSQTVGLIDWFLPSSYLQRVSDDRFVVDNVSVIDSTPLRLAINFGALVMILLLIPIVIATYRVISQRGGPACVALVGQIPALAVTSLITQWPVLVFFVMGMAVTEMTRAKPTRSESAPPTVTRRAALRGSPASLS